MFYSWSDILLRIMEKLQKCRDWLCEIFPRMLAPRETSKLTLCCVSLLITFLEVCVCVNVHILFVYSLICKLKHSCPTPTEVVEPEVPKGCQEYRCLRPLGLQHHLFWDLRDSASSKLSFTIGSPQELIVLLLTLGSVS